MTDQRWVTYGSERFGSVTKLENERPPKVGAWQQRPATKREIAKEKKKRAIQERQAEEQRIFRDRQDYKDAEAIRGLLELMTYDNNPLEYLTPREWAELRRKLGA